MQTPLPHAGCFRKDGPILRRTRLSETTITSLTHVSAACPQETRTHVGILCYSAINAFGSLSPTFCLPTRTFSIAIVVRRISEDAGNLQVTAFPNSWPGTCSETGVRGTMPSCWSESRGERCLSAEPTCQFTSSGTFSLRYPYSSPDETVEHLSALAIKSAMEGNMSLLKWASCQEVHERPPRG